MARAALLMSLGMMLIPLGDTFGKLLMQTGVAPVFVAWTRFAFGVLLLLPFLGRRHFMPAAFADWRVILRALLIVFGILSIMTALRTEPIANVFGAFFVGPILSYALSARFLGERVTLARTLLMLLGFAGVMMVVKPGFGMSPGLGFAVLAGVFYGTFLTASRWLASVAPPRTLLLTQLAIGAVVLAPFGLAAAPPIDAQVGFLAMMSAAGSMAGNLLLILAYKLAPATRLAPLVYVQLIGATLYGVLVFGTLPDAVALAGLALLLVSGFASFWLRR